MKMSYEAMLIAYLSMFFIALGLNIANLVITHQNASLYHEYAIMMIEHFNRYDEEIANSINQNATMCTSCTLNVIKYTNDDEVCFEIKVSYVVKMPFLNRVFQNELVALTSS